ncbi:MAG: amidase [Gammaproteobacteria bacterium]|nr:amidase [Gammaproteobacteria bacterium]
MIDVGVGATLNSPLRVGWLVEPGFGPIESDVAATVRAAAEALKRAGVIVEPVRISVLEQIDSTDVFFKLQVMEAKPEFKKVTAGHEADIFKYAQLVLDRPDTSISDFVHAEQQAENLKDGFAKYFQRYDALLCPVTPVPAHKHGATEFVINGQKVPALNIMKATAPFNVTGLPALSMRFGTSHDGLPIAVQVVAPWLAESTVLHLATLLEGLSPVRNLRPNLKI